jgi:hypothetical protein
VFHFILERALCYTKPGEPKARLGPPVEGCEAHGPGHHLNADSKIFQRGHHKGCQVVSNQIETDAGGQVDRRGDNHPWNCKVSQNSAAKLLSVAFPSCYVQ